MVSAHLAQVHLAHNECFLFIHIYLLLFSHSPVPEAAQSSNIEYNPDVFIPSVHFANYLK